VSFTNTSATAGSASSNVWSLGNGTQLNGNSASYLFTIGGCYDVTLTSTVGGCVGTTTIQNFICVENPPIASFQTNPVEFSNSTESVNFNNISIGGSSYFWDFGDGTTSTDMNPQHIFTNTEAGATVTLTTTSSIGCVDTYTIYIDVNTEPIFYIPNTFTPDGDGYNQVFKPIFHSGYDPYNFNMKIYNRWGEVMFETFDANIGWDGSYGIDGRDAQNGTYTYKIVFKNPKKDDRIVVNGHVNIIR
jgi:gliding motility-associated-like protein